VTPAFAAFARSCGFVVDPCRVRTPRETGNVERRVRVGLESLAPPFCRSWTEVAPLQVALDERPTSLQQRLPCPMIGTLIVEAW
jgi:hypothetical protein